MLKELFDIVDENNAETGETKPRSEVHSSGLWHRTVHIYYFKEQNEVISFLVHLRSKTKDLYPNCWDTRFGGHVKAGETIEQTVVVEIKEEIGLKIKISNVLKGPIRKADKFPNREFTHVFFLKGSESLKGLSFEDNEVQEVKWMTSDEMIESMKNEPDRWSGSLEGFEFMFGQLKESLRQ